MRHIYIHLIFLLFLLTAACEPESDLPSQEEKCLPQTDLSLGVLTGGNFQTWRLTGYSDSFFRGYNINPPIEGTPLTVTFRNDNTFIKPIIGGISKTGPTLTGQGPIGQGKVSFDITGNQMGDYCLKKIGNNLILKDLTNGPAGTMPWGDKIVTFPDPNTLILADIPGSNIDEAVLTYTKQ